MSQHEPGEPSSFTRPHGLRPLGEPGSIASGAEGSSGSNSGKWTGAVDPGVEPRVDPGVGTSAPVRFAEFPVGTASSKAPAPLRMAAWMAAVALTASLMVGWLVRPQAPEPEDVPDMGVPSNAPTLGGPVNTPRSYPPSPLPSSAMAPAPPAQEIAEYRWSVRAKVLRPELDAPRSLFSPDGSADGAATPQAKGVWVVMTGQTGIAAKPRVPDAKVRVHGLDAGTGRQLWHREMPFGLCATQLLGDRLACASSLARDDRTGLPTTWRLQLLDPATGKILAQRAVDAWLAMLTVRQDRLVLVEQRQPAPRLVVSGYSSSLTPVWRAAWPSRPSTWASSAKTASCTGRTCHRPTALPCRSAVPAGGLDAGAVGGRPDGLHQSGRREGASGAPLLPHVRRRPTHLVQRAPACRRGWAS